MKLKSSKKIIEYIIVIMMSILIIIPNGVYANALVIVNEYNTRKINAEDQRLLDEYVKNGNNNYPYFDIDKAIMNGESEEILEIGKAFNKFSYDMSQSETGEALSSVISLPIWGNWCGPGYGSGKPIDLLDEGCRQHDNCYIHGGNNCKCNRKLINYINNNLERMTRGQYIMAIAIRLYFQRENSSNGC